MSFVDDAWSKGLRYVVLIESNKERQTLCVKRAASDALDHFPCNVIVRAICCMAIINGGVKYHDRMTIEYFKSALQFAGEHFGHVLHLFTFYLQQLNLCLIWLNLYLKQLNLYFK